MRMGRSVGWAVVVVTLVAASARAEIIDRVMAVVGSQVVTLSDVRAAETFGLLPAAAKTTGPGDLLASLINRQLMLSDVERYSAPEPDAAVVARRMREVRAAFRSDAEYAKALDRTAMSDDRLRGLVADNLRIEAYVEQRFAAVSQPTPDEVLRYYREHPAEFTTAGRLAAFDDVQQVAQQSAAAERKRALITDWLDRLQRSGQVEVVTPAPVTGIR